MFICQSCCSERGILYRFEIASKSMGSCELCNNRKLCGDIPSKYITVKKSIEQIFLEVFPTHNFKDAKVVGDIQKSISIYSLLGEQLLCTRVDKVGNQMFIAYSYVQDGVFHSLPISIKQAMELCSSIELYKCFNQ